MQMKDCQTDLDGDASHCFLADVDRCAERYRLRQGPDDLNVDADPYLYRITDAEVDQHETATLKLKLTR